MDLKAYIKEVTSRFSIGDVTSVLTKAKELKVLLVGDTIIDHYVFVQPKGRAIKDPILSTGYLNEEKYAGGAIAIANHLSDFVKEIRLVTLLGDQISHLEFIKDTLKKNVDLVTFIKKNSPTTVKKRFIDFYRKNKLFKVEYMDDSPVTEELSGEISRYLETEIKKYDLVLVSDFGHGFIDNQIKDVLQKNAKFLAINVQSNSANMGFNYFTKYPHAHFRSIDEQELRLPLSMRFEPVNLVLQKTTQHLGLTNLLVTRGKNGCIYLKDSILEEAPILTHSVKDTIGAGDAVFAITSLLSYCDTHPKLLPFVANCVGGIAANIMGNKESIRKQDLLRFMEEVFNKHEVVDINEYFNAVSSTIELLDRKSVAEFARILLDVYDNKGTIYAFGNGGSGATASHFCGDLVKGVSYGLEKRFKAICLNDNIPALMAIANDISYDDIFVEQLKNFLTEKDVVVGISGSGNSANVVKALEYAKTKGATTLAICGYKGGKIKEIADLAIHAEIDDMEVSEDIHNLIITHCVKKILTKKLNNTNLGEEYEKRVSCPADVPEQNFQVDI